MKIHTILASVYRDFIVLISVICDGIVKED